MAAIYVKYRTNHEFDRFNPVFPHPTNISKYLPLTSGNVQKWGDALLHKTPGVSLESPPSDLVFRTLTKKLEASIPAPAPRAPPIEPNTHLTNGSLSPDAPQTHTIGDYLASIDCDSAEVQEILVILSKNGFKSYRLFGSSHVDNPSLLKLGITLGLIL
ncbi:hypothetical protein PCANC_12417 [Puccinia coronata f. sp. avenae]|uniref:Uncharacterized protein n=1 Tax=Puccinia coronata f. sp. avenae TaxID=200324 RepID=A0A2N5UER2_9BASI|nr:hypothetical protein PCASD_12082 [Puccinia coronata f. sp. avenae]PLW47239.1 hypothetical protein PCANC_12417 [Puccinia coronata f. sp. avenae]